MLEGTRNFYFLSAFLLELLLPPSFSLSTDPLFCLEFFEIARKVLTVRDLKKRERKGGGSRARRK